MSISAIILSFNAKHDLERCVRSLINVEGLSGGHDQILIVDNGSVDGSRAVIEGLAISYPNLVEPIFLPVNQGTTAPRNLGIARSRGEHLLVIDSDIEFRTPVLARMIGQLAADRSIGIVAPKLVFPDGRPQMSTDVFPTIPRKLERLLRLRALERRSPRADAECWPVDYAISAFWLMRRELIDLVGPLDERIFYAPEDVDFCLRTWLKGKRVVYRPDLDVVHDAKERSRSLKGMVFAWRHVLGLAYYFRKHRYAFSASSLYRRMRRPRFQERPATPAAAREFPSGAGG